MRVVVVTVLCLRNLGKEYLNNWSRSVKHCFFALLICNATLIAALAGHAATKNNYGVPNNLLQMAEAGDAESMYIVAFQYYLPKAWEKNDDLDRPLSIYNEDAFKKAIIYLEKAANKGHIGACKALGNLYATEEKIKNNKKSIYYYTIPVKQGDIESILKLAEAYRATGDYDSGIHWYTKYIEYNKFDDLKCADAFISLSTLYDEKRSSRKSKTKAYACIQIAFLLTPANANRGSYYVNRVATLYQSMSPAEKQTAVAIIERWRREKAFDDLESASLTPPASYNSPSSLSPPASPASPVPASSATRSPSDAELEQFWLQSPQFAQAETELNNLFTEIMQRISGDARREFITSQRQWLNTDRNEYAEYLMQEQQYSKLQAYLTAIQERARHLALYARQLQNPTTPTTLIGVPDNTFCTDTCKWKFFADGFLDPFELGEVLLVHEKFAHLGQQLSAAKAANASVRISGILRATTGFDLTSVKIVSKTGAEQAPVGMVLDTYKKDDANPNL